MISWLTSVQTLGLLLGLLALFTFLFYIASAPSIIITIKYTDRKCEASIVEDVNLKIIDSWKCFWLLTCWEYEAVFRTQNRILEKLVGQPGNYVIHTHSNKLKREVLAEWKNGTAPLVCLKQVNIVSETQFSFLVFFKDFFFSSKKLFNYLFLAIAHGDWTQALEVQMWSPNHWIFREVPKIFTILKN